MGEVSVLNPNYNRTITLYNRRKAEDSPEKKETWKRTVLTGCFYRSEIRMSQSGMEDSVQNTYTVRIPQSSDYHPYGEWKTDMVGFTISADDIVVPDVCEEEIGTGSAPVLLLKNKPGAFRITAWSDNTSHISGKHYRLGG